MPLPGVTIDIVEALARPGAPTNTGTWFLVFTAGSGTDVPTLITDPTKITATYGSTSPVGVIRDYVSSAMREGASRVIAVRAPSADAAGYTSALAALDPSYGPGQVSIPGDSTPAAHDALIAHAGAHLERVALLDADPAATAAELVATAVGYREEVGAKRATIVAGTATVAAPVNTTRVIPGSVFLAALIARGDARVGHTNHTPAGAHDGGAGQVLSLPAGSATLSASYTYEERGELFEAGVTTFSTPQGTLTVEGFPSLDVDGVYRQLNVGRLLMQVYVDLNLTLAEFVNTPTDGGGRKYARVESALVGYLLPLEDADALYGANGSSFSVSVAEQNTAADVTAAIIRAAVELTPTFTAERIALTINVHTPGA